MPRYKKTSWMAADELKQRREAMGLTQAAVSEMVDISVRQISYMENGTQPVSKIFAAFIINLPGLKIPKKTEAK